MDVIGNEGNVFFVLRIKGIFMKSSCTTIGQFE